MAKQIVLVEDEDSIRQNYADAFNNHGYDVAAFKERDAAYTACTADLPDLAIIDIGLEDEPEGGYELCRQLRNLSATLPIIFLTARDSDFDQISGLRLGADDYLSKDVSIPQILARIAALFRRVEAMQSKQENNKTHEVGGLVIDADRMTVHWNRQLVELTLTEFWMVYSLSKIPGHVKSRDQLMQDANIFVDDGTVTSHIKRIRRKFEELDKEFDCIDTVYGIGYRWKN